MRPLHIALAALVAAIWGVNFVVIKIGIGEFPPLLFCALRFLAAALPMVFFLPRPNVSWGLLIAIGMTLGVVKFGILFIAMDIGAPAGLSSLVLQSQALFTVLFAAAALGERPGGRQLLGIAVAFAGIAVIAEAKAAAGGNLLALGLVVLAAAFWGVANLLMKRASGANALHVTVWMSLVPPLPLFALSYLWEGPERIGAALSGLNLTGLWSLGYIAYLSTLLGFGLWSWLLRRYPASMVAPFSLLVPLFGLSSAALFLGEPIGPQTLVAAALVLAGLALVVLKRPAAPQPAVARP